MPITLFHFLYLLPLLITAQTTTNKTSGSSLKPGDDPWLSPSGDFAFGFKQASPGAFLLAIWFNNVPDKTITWSANRDQLAPTGSILQLTIVGRLVLTDPSGNMIWTALSDVPAFAASVLDTGNFVLVNQNSVILWQSFDHPTDTILPTQTLPQGEALISQLSSTNYSSGRFSLTINETGLVFSTLNWPENSIEYFQYYSIKAQGNVNQVVYNRSGVIYINTTIVLSKEVASNQFYQRAVLEFDGVFRKYVHPRLNSTQGSMSWRMLDYAPLDICSLMQGAGSERGRGACGYNSYCQISSDHRPYCVCPPGYVFVDQTDHIRGCEPGFEPQSCLEEDQLGESFELVALNHTNFWGSDYDTFEDGQTESSCQEACLSDCLCAAVVFNAATPASQCWKKRFPLSDGWRNESSYAGADTYIKVGSGELGGVVKEATQNHGLILALSLLFGFSGFLNVFFIISALLVAKFCAQKWRARRRKLQNSDIPGTSMRNFMYWELQEATHGFKEVVGQGAFAIVYKGSLDTEEGTAIAVKKLDNIAKESQREFESEVKAIAKTGHKNLVQLIGFCNENQHRLLVYKYMPNGSLTDVLFQQPRPRWSQRVKFAFEIARGLNYLHEECSIQIIHCDIKPQNILLDESFTARISDFGLAKLLKKDQTQTITGIRGTKGYVAPEWFKSMPITTKVDVYSYGVLLLELICCRKCFMPNVEDESQMVLADWAYDCYKEGMVQSLVEGDDEAMAEIETVKKLVMVALWCVHDLPSARPSMKKVLQLIQDGVEESLPPDLVLCSDMNVGCDDTTFSSSEAFL